MVQPFWQTCVRPPPSASWCGGVQAALLACPSSPDSPRARRGAFLAALAGVAVPLLLWAVLPLGSSGATPGGRLDRLQDKIEATQGKIGRRKGTERVLTTEISAYTRRIGRLQGRIGSLQQRQSTIETDLAAQRAALARIQSDLRAERRRLVRLRARLQVTAARWPTGWWSSTRRSSRTSSP
jgi:septal ring factor EnvC (AmiA/AmiB activator)